MLINLYLSITIMNFLIIFIVYFFSPSSSISDRKLRLSFVQSNLSGWKTCTSCKMNKPSTVKDVKLEIQDINDNVDFHLSHFITQLKSHFDSIKDGIDESYSSRFQKASERVIEKLENIKATIKVNYKELSNSLDHSKVPIAQINSSLKNAKKVVEEFVSNGIESFLKVFKSLKSEFTLKSKMDDKKQDSPTNQESPSSDNSKQDQQNDKSKFIETDKNQKGNQNENKKQNEEENENKKDSENDKKKDDKLCLDKSDNCEPEKIDLSSIPPEAVIRTIDTYLDDVNIEGKKLLDSVLINMDN